VQEEKKIEVRKDKKNTFFKHL